VKLTFKMLPASLSTAVSLNIKVLAVAVELTAAKNSLGLLVNSGTSSLMSVRVIR